MLAVKDGLASGDLRGAELFLFTDNSTMKGGYYKGNTDSKVLFDLVLHLQTLDMHVSIKLQMIHTAGTWMIQQGTDGLSWGDNNSCVMAGNDMLSYIPLHLSTIDRMPTLLQ